MTEYSESDDWILPMPSVFIIDQNGIIRFADLNADYTSRVEPKTIIDNLKKI
ncbi:hypothetical protein [Orenia marismortui]|uniref:AhpC/TSA family protein n=1 Tax=Orenia marismortui TaxID=46469 RepID=A0A4V3GXU0_9FIRM|nr:hypothetical protein [Orenia marismortui]TDX49054.1 hypothetical protein C7959_1217 [Orenia marismortui]